MAESSLYPIVGDFLKRKLGCFYVQARPTVTRHGAVDVVGLRQNPGKYGGNAEVIAVEVKASGSRFLNSAGQALGYSVMADRCYLAISGDGVGEVESELASQLNIGLIVIRSGRRCEIVLTSPQHRPLRAQKLTLIHRLGFVECAGLFALDPRCLTRTTTRFVWLHEPRKDFGISFPGGRTVARSGVSFALTASAHSLGHSAWLCLTRRWSR